MTRWALIAAGVGSEVSAALSMKAAADQPWLYFLAIASYAAANVFLVLVLRRGMTIGFAYGIVGALTVAGTAITSSIVFA